MNALNSSFLIYGLIGLGVAVAVYLSDMARTPVQRCFQTAASVIFWPLFLPFILRRNPARPAVLEEAAHPSDEMAKAIRQVETELATALQAIDGFDANHACLDRLHACWIAQADRIREMDRLLASPQYTVPNDAIQAEKPILRDGVSATNRLGAINALSAVVERLREVRERTHAEFLQSLAAVRELTALLHLARFSREDSPSVTEIVAKLEDLADRLEPTNPDSPLPCGVDDSAGRG
jgi:hypothetical protein